MKRWIQIHYGYYNAWPNYKYGTNYYYLEIVILQRWGRSWKLDFWNKKDLAGWEITISNEGTACKYIGGEGIIIDKRTNANR